MKQRPLMSSILSVMVCFVLLAVISGCKKSEEVLPDPTGVLLQSTGCKAVQSDNGLNGTLDEGVDDCIEYSFDGQSTLVLKHINAGFNCCPGEVTAEITFNGNVVTIEEAESDQGCHCLCLFDLDFEVVNLKPGVYSIRIIEPYVEDGNQVLEFDLNLVSTSTGRFCLNRTYYPWIK